VKIWKGLSIEEQQNPEVALAIARHQHIEGSLPSGKPRSIKFKLNTDFTPAHRWLFIEIVVPFPVELI
jgi:hypothetical protein